MPPNIVYLNSHDTGRYVQPYGHAIPTPNIQWLADQGVMFRNAFCAAPSCSGSRAALLTGEYCHTNGMMGLAHRGFALNDIGHHMVRTLSAAGYHTGLIGEQHVSVDPAVLGYDIVHDVPDTNASSVAPAAIEALSNGVAGAVLPVGRASSRPTAASSRRARCAIGSTRCRRRSSPTPPRSGSTWRPTRPAPARSIMGSAPSSTSSTRPVWTATRS